MKRYSFIVRWNSSFISLSNNEEIFFQYDVEPLHMYAVAVHSRSSTDYKNIVCMRKSIDIVRVKLCNTKRHNPLLKYAPNSFPHRAHSLFSKFGDKMQRS